MKKILSILTLVLLIALTGCEDTNTDVFAELVPENIRNVAEDTVVDYLPVEGKYFAVAEFSAPKAVTLDWVDTSFKDSDCEIFRSLYAGDYITEEWLNRLDGAVCHRNAVVIENNLAPYNELTLLLFEDQVLLYAAGQTEAN